MAYRRNQLVRLEKCITADEYHFFLLFRLSSKHAFKNVLNLLTTSLAVNLEGGS